MEILINNETEFELTAELEGLLNAVATAAVKNEDLGEDVEISVSFVDNEQIRAINKRYRKLDKPTDVLSFPQYATSQALRGLPSHDSGALVLGDVVISVERAREQAEDYGHSFKREFGFLAAHGILHLLGYDHQDEASEKAMLTLQEDILNICGLQKAK